jgi:glycerol kinase
MNGGDVIVAIDQGGHATRAVAYDHAGRLLGDAAVPVDTHRAAGGRVEHDGEQLVESVGAALSALAARIDPDRWQAVGLGVQRSSIACWDRVTGQLLSPVISWQDRRQAAWLQQFGRHAGRVHELTGLPLSPHYGASKLRWCLDELPAVREAASRRRLCAGPLASLLLARLLDGAPCVADEANASRTQLWSPHDRAWSAPLLSLFGVPEDILPRLVPTRGPFGQLRLAAAGVPLRACTGDQAAVPFSSGPLEPGTAYVNLGTGAFVLRPVPGPVAAAPLLTSVLDSDGTRVLYALEGTVNGAGSALDWLGQQQGVDAHGLLAQLDAAASAAAPPLFLNGVSGVGSPFWIPGFESRFVGSGQPLQQLHAVLESIAFLLRANLDAMQPHAGRPDRIVASGGLSRSSTLLATLASLTGITVERLDDPEATARGVAFLAAAQPGGWIAPCRQSYRPAPDEALAARYAHWLALMREAADRRSGAL